MRALSPRAWPMAFKVPLFVALLMAGLALVIGQVVLHRLSRDQERHLAELASAYLDGVSTAVLPAAIRRDVWEAFEALDRARDRYRGIAIVVAIVTEPSGTVLAASAPRLFPVGSVLPEPLLARFPDGDRLVIDAAAERGFIARELREGEIAVGRILVELDIAALIAERAEVRLALVAVNAAIAVLLAAAGFWLVRRMLAPLSILRAHVAAGEDGAMTPVPEAVIARQPPEFAALFRAFNRTARALAEREAMAARLAEEEKYALLGKLASGLAHEVNNPLGGLFTAVDTLSRHGADPEVRQRTLALLRRGLADIRTVVRASLVTAKERPGQGALRPEDIDDLRLLVRHEAERKGIRLIWRNDLAGELALDRTMVRQVVLNLLLNAVAASPEGSTVSLAAQIVDGSLRVTVADSGGGLPPWARHVLAHPEEGPPTGGGLGLWTAARLARALGGRILVEAAPGGSRLGLAAPIAGEPALAA